MSVDSYQGKVVPLFLGLRDFPTRFSHPTPYLAFFIFSVESRVLAVCKYTFAESPPHFFISSFSSFPRCILRRCGNAQRGRSSCSRTRGKNSKYKKREIALKRTRNFKVEPAFFCFFLSNYDTPSPEERAPVNLSACTKSPAQSTILLSRFHGRFPS